MTSVYNLIEKKEHKILGAQFRHWHTALVSADGNANCELREELTQITYTIPRNQEHTVTTSICTL